MSEESGSLRQSGLGRRKKKKHREPHRLLLHRETGEGGAGVLSILGNAAPLRSSCVCVFPGKGSLDNNEWNLHFAGSQMRSGSQSILRCVKGKEGARSEYLWAAHFSTYSTARLTHGVSLVLPTALGSVLCSPCSR